MRGVALDGAERAVERPVGALPGKGWGSTPLLPYGKVLPSKTHKEDSKMRQTVKDPNLPHQVVLESQGNRIVVSCNCRRVRKGFAYKHEPIAIVSDRKDTAKMYNQPGVHRNHPVPFGPTWEIHYRDEEPGVTVNDRDEFMSREWSHCWICGVVDDHGGTPHSVAVGDGLTRYDIVDRMNQGGYKWRDAM